MNKEQMIEVLKVLKNMQTCASQGITYIPGVGDCHNKDENYVSPFNLHKSFGICWHVYANTYDPFINMDFLKPVFVELGYNELYPVESTFMPGSTEEQLTHYSFYINPYDKYNGTTLEGVEHLDCAVRRKLLNELVEYFENKLASTL